MVNADHRHPSPMHHQSEAHNDVSPPSPAVPAGASGSAAASSSTTTPSIDLSTSTVTIRALVSSREAGAVIGKGGATVAQIRDDAQVRVGVSKSEPGIMERVLTVAGLVKKVSFAFALIATAILDSAVSSPDYLSDFNNNHHSNNNNNNNNNSKTTSIKLLIPHQQMGSIIGRQGQRIKSIQEECAVRMVAAKEMLPQSTERVVEVSGTPSSIERAVQLIAECLVQDSDRAKGSISYVPQHGMTSAQQAAAGIAAITTAHVMARAGSSIPPNSSPSSSTSILPAGGNTSIPPPSSPPASLLYQTTPTYPSAASHSPFASGHSSVSASPSPRASPLGKENTNIDRSSPSPAYTSSVAATNHHNQHQHHQQYQQPVSRSTSTSISTGGGLHHQSGVSSSSHQSSRTSPHTTVHEFAVPGDMVGCLIGRGGVKIQQIRKESGANISIAKVSQVDASGERMFTIRGPPRAIERALWLLYQQLEAEMQSRQR